MLVHQHDGHQQEITVLLMVVVAVVQVELTLQIVLVVLRIIPIIILQITVVAHQVIQIMVHQEVVVVQGGQEYKELLMVVVQLEIKVEVVVLENRVS